MAELLTSDERNRHIDVLNRSTDRDAVAASALVLAGSEDPEAIQALAGLLGRAEFLARLDNVAEPASEIRNLLSVFGTLMQHPTADTALLCERVYPSEEFRSVGARVNLLLATLAAVRPVTETAADIFRASSQAGFAEVNGPLLIANESPLALQVFAEIITGDWVESYIKVDILHNAVLPSRTHLQVLEMCDQILLGELDAEVRTGVVETLFDEQSRLWFGPAIGAPMAPPWEATPTEALELLTRIADRVLAAITEDLLREAVEGTRAEVEGILISRRK